MQRKVTILLACALVVWAGWTLSVSAQAGPQTAAAAPAGPDAAALRAALDTYCVACHNPQVRSRDLALDAASVDTAHVDRAADTWEKVVRKLRTRTMPPRGMPRPGEETYAALTAWLETRLDWAAAERPSAGRALIRRLNRTEYATAVRDLLDLEFDVTTLLPGDDSAFGFDNISDMLGVSPALLERYLVAADRVSALAVGAPVEPGSQTYHIRQDRSQDQHIEGLPLGTVGGIAVRHTFPVDGEYHFALTLYRTQLSAIRGLERPHQIEITIDGERVFLHTVGGESGRGRGGNVTERSDAIDAELQVRVPVKAGPRTVVATFIRKITAGSTRLQPFLRSSADSFDSTGRPHIQTLTIAGPFDATGPGDTPSRRRIFTCRPSTAADEEPCAVTILTTLARRALRRPASVTELDRLMDFYRAGHAQGGFERGIQLGLRRLLASPSFVYRVEEDVAEAASGANVRVSDLELASRLSFFLWSSLPDDTLLDLAVAGRLSDPRVLEEQTRRMLADPKAIALATNFAGQWLHVRNLRNIAPNSDEFPDFDDTLRDAFRREVELFFDSIVREDRSVLDLLDADYTFVNERLAKHYGLRHVYGSHFRRVTLSDETRRGILGKGALLMVTSHADRTAPTLRGKWILENLLGIPPPAPPADVPGLEDSDGAAAPRSMRERLERHRASPGCASCHALMDPLGFALEQFDAVGAYRAAERGRPIDASGHLADGTDVDGVVELRRALLERSDVFVQTFTEKLMTYALGRGLEPHDMPVVRAIVREAADREHRVSAIILGIVRSVPFQMRTRANMSSVLADASTGEPVHAGGPF